MLVFRLFDMRRREAIRCCKIGAQGAFFPRNKYRASSGRFLIGILIANVQTVRGRLSLQNLGIIVSTNATHVSGDFWFLQKPLHDRNANYLLSYESDFVVFFFTQINLAMSVNE